MQQHIPPSLNHLSLILSVCPSPLCCQTSLMFTLQSPDYTLLAFDNATAQNLVKAAIEAWTCYLHVSDNWRPCRPQQTPPHSTTTTTVHSREVSILFCLPPHNEFQTIYVTISCAFDFLQVCFFFFLSIQYMLRSNLLVKSTSMLRKSLLCLRSDFASSIFKRTVVSPAVFTITF